MSANQGDYLEVGTSQGAGKVKGKGEGKLKQSKYFIHMSENTIMKPFTIAFKGDQKRVIR
jgi:hypothetical protein